MRKLLRALWEGLRTVSGDNAYERYLAHHASAHHGRPPLSRRQFYAEYTTRKWTGINRCC